MSEFHIRQFVVLQSTVSEYRLGNLGLNALIQRIEGIGEVLELDAWKEAVMPIVWSMEQINACALEEKRRLTETEAASIEASLRELEALIHQFEVDL